MEDNETDDIVRMLIEESNHQSGSAAELLEGAASEIDLLRDEKDDLLAKVEKLNATVAELQATANSLSEKLNGANLTIERLKQALDAKPEVSDFGGMDPECYYAKSCGHEAGGCQLCKERRQVVGGVYYSDELGDLDEKAEEDLCEGCEGECGICGHRHELGSRYQRMQP